MNLAKDGMVVEKQVHRASEDVPSLINGGDSDSPLSDFQTWNHLQSRRSHRELANPQK
jgi:hypothetical protein